MFERSDLRQLGKLLRLRQAQAQAAAATALSAALNKDSAEGKFGDAETARDDANATWLRMLDQDRPDPAMLKFGSGWLLEQERRLDEEKLNLSIAENRLNQARNDYSQSLARRTVAAKIGAQVRRTIENRLDERQSLQMADAWLWRQHR